MINGMIFVVLVNLIVHLTAAAEMRGPIDWSDSRFKVSAIDKLDGSIVKARAPIILVVPVLGMSHARSRRPGPATSRPRRRGRR